MGVEEKLKVAHGALRNIADMDSGELAKHGRRIALRALAFTDADTPGAPGRQEEIESRAITQLIGRVELVVREAVTKGAVDRYPMTWVKLDRYVEISGDSVDSVQSRRKAGKWLDGNQCKIVDGRLWINLQAVDEWIERWGKRYLAR
ncbi:hypothetical protein SAMN02982985_04752 [Rugamonas rubra]|uniref:Excisionase n=1 Tax=Rugamonas rubra TaxID=758825 RepID=A0A1I4SFS9_9BURK|nr:hypothetical protein SAMN02982985_04752 [Rugamonas rubra]